MKQIKQMAAEKQRIPDHHNLAAEASRRGRMRDSRKSLERFVASLPKVSGSERLIRKDRDR
jgi:hypothetical protein